MAAPNDIEQSARKLVRELKGQWYSSYGMCVCPAHDDKNPSLRISAGRVKVVFHCSAGCDYHAIASALRQLNWRAPEIQPGEPDIPRQDTADRRRLVNVIWKRASPVQGTLGHQYLIGRGIDRFLSFPRFGETITIIDEQRITFPALILPISNGGTQLQAIQRILLDPISGEKSSLLRKPKRTFGAIRDGAVRLGVVDDHLHLAEGYEDAVSVRILNDLPNCWAVCGVERYALVGIPDRVRKITIWSQHGDAARAAIAKAQSHLTAGGRSLTVEMPLPGGDWNDQLVQTKQA